MLGSIHGSLAQLPEGDPPRPFSAWAHFVQGNLSNVQVLLIGVLIFLVCYLASKLLEFSILVLWAGAAFALLLFVR